MKILVVDHNAIDPTHRGVYTRIASAPGVELSLIVPNRWHDGFRMIHFEKGPGIATFPAIPLDVYLPTRTHRLVYRGLGKELRRFRPDIFYMNAEPENFQTWQAAGLVRYNRNIRLVCSSWRNIDHVAIGYPYRFGWLHRRIESVVLRRTDHLVCFTSEGPSLFGRHGFGRTSHISPAIDITLFSGEKSGTIARSGDVFTVGFVGRCVHEKGIDLLLRALARLDRRVRGRIVGDGPDRPALIRLADELGLGERVEWKSGVSRQDVPAILRTMDVLVLPSRTTSMWKEQFGRILAEAMASGIPVIGSRSGEIPHVIGDCGLLFDEENDAELAGLIGRIRDESDLRSTLVSNGLRRCQDQFSITSQAAGYLALFQSLADTPVSAGIS